METGDFRNINGGSEIPSENYCDQPYVVIADNGAWVCVMTTGSGDEGESGQHIVCHCSTDYGKTWVFLSDVEPADGPEASYAVLLKAPGGRIFCFYNHNTDDRRYVLGDPGIFPGGKVYRVDSQGHFVFRYSDDHGATWSDRRYDIPIRTTEIDRNNPYRGEVKYFWNVGRAFMHDGSAYVPLTKVGGFGHGFFSSNEGFLLRCDGLDSVTSPEQFEWTTLPDGEEGIRNPAGGGPVSEEHYFTVLSDGSFYCTFRTIDGLSACAYSRDKGRTWTSDWNRYADGRPIRNCRGPNFCWRCENGKYLLWHYNNGSKDFLPRNIVWLSGGVEADSPDGKVILWGQGEILSYADDPFQGRGYPDFIETDGRYFYTETNKWTARVHEIPADFLEMLWSQHRRSELCIDGLICEWTSAGNSMEMPKLPNLLELRGNHPPLDRYAGFSMEIYIEADEFTADLVIFDSRDANGAGILLKTGENASVEVQISDAECRSCWTSDKDVLKRGLRHIGVVVDGGPKTILLTIDGVMCDGAGDRVYGYGRYSPWLSGVNGAARAVLGSGNTHVKRVRLYDRALSVSEMIGNFRYGL